VGGGRRQWHPEKAGFPALWGDKGRGTPLPPAFVAMLRLTAEKTRINQGVNGESDVGKKVYDVFFVSK
jgi:hypothetical protein